MRRGIAIAVASAAVVTCAIPASRTVQSSWDPGVGDGPAGGPPPACVDQPPDRAGSLFSDLDCDGCASSPHVVAENFTLATDESIDEIRFWGVYFGDGVAPPADRFTVILRDDAGGLPGTAIRTIGPAPATTRTITGNQVAGLDEHEYTIDLDPNQDLAAATYWVEIYNDTGGCPWDCGDGNDDVGIGDFLAVLGTWGQVGAACDLDGGGVGITEFLKIIGNWGPCPDKAWAWETGTLDVVNGVAGSATSASRGGAEAWQADSADLALSMTCSGNPFGCPGEGDCCEDNGSAGCDDAECCRAVCAIIPLCCEVTWASVCADLALEQSACGCFDCESPAKCQSSDLSNAFIADGTTWIAADDVVIDEPAATSVTSLCWRGIYFDNTISDNCGPGPDDFRLRYYQDDGTGLPGALLAEYRQSMSTLIVSPPSATGQQIGNFATEYQHTAEHAALPVSPGQCLWVEVTNLGPAAPCMWFWNVSGDGDGYSMHDGTPPDGYDATDARDSDYSFCLDVGIGGTPPCPQQPLSPGAVRLGEGAVDRP